MDNHDAGYELPLRLTAAKSLLGHTEPAAGSVGIAHALSVLKQYYSSSLKHLRNVSPHILGASKKGDAMLALPRQRIPVVSIQSGLGVDDWMAIQGVSSFAFQGTNAHVVLCLKGHVGKALRHIEHKTSCWYKLRHWYTESVHQLLHASTVNVAHNKAIFQTAILRACLGEPPYTLEYGCLKATCHAPVGDESFVLVSG